MATPITHIVLADKIFDSSFSGLSKKDFLIGTSFPDIRYLGVIDRRSTHFSDLSFDDIRNEKDSFMAGVKFHAIADRVRESYVVSNGIYEQIPKSKYIIESLKFFEDEIFYENFNGWDELIKEFGEIPYQKIIFNVEKTGVDKWYSLLREYFTKKPTVETRRALIKDLGFNDEDIQGIERTIQDIKKIPIIKEKTLELYNDFESLLKV